MNYEEKLKILLSDNANKVKLASAIDILSDLNIFNYLREHAGDVLMTEVSQLNGSGLVIKGSFQTIRALETILDKERSPVDNKFIKSRYGATEE